MRAFSLVELLIVVAIISVLSAIAVPIYKLYSVKVSISEGYQDLYILADRAKIIYGSKGSYPTSITFLNGTNVPNSGWTTVNSNNFSSVSYTISTDGLGIIIQGSLNGLTAIPGYVAGYSGNSSVIQLALRDFNGTMREVCGLWTPTDVPSVPLIYQPPSCTCTNINTFAVSGTGC